MGAEGIRKNQSPCTYPWTTLKITFTGETNLCCANHDNLGDLTALDIDQIWNGAAVQRIRRDLAGGNFAQSSCRNCPYVGVWRIDQLPAEITAAESPLQEVAREWENGTIAVRTRPYELFLYFPFNCNLDCVMCMQVPDRKAGEANMLPMDDRLLDTVRQWCLANYGKLSMLGGEVFVQKRAIGLIDFLIEKQLHKIRLTITTNGTVLDRFWPKLEKIDKLSLCFSCDAVRPDLYAAIRVKGQWADVDRNMRRMRAAVRVRPQWSMNMAAVIQRRNLGHLRDIVAYCNALDITCLFSQMFGDHAMSENVFLNPRLLQACPGWQEDCEEAIALAAACPNDSARLTHNTLVSVFSRLKEAAEAPMPPVAAQPLLQLGSRLQALPSRRLRIKNTIKRFLPTPVWCLLRSLKQLSR